MNSHVLCRSSLIFIWFWFTGVPIGGLGCGTIGRGFRGEFCRYQLVPGRYEFQTVEANTFTVCIRRRHMTTYCQVLTTQQLRQKGLHRWNTAFSKEFGHYQALYPQSWTTYDLPGQNVRLLCKQISPFIPHNYKDSSLPVASFVWYIENLDDAPIDVSIMFTWQAGSATTEFVSQDIFHQAVHISNDNESASGVSIKQKLRDMKLEYCILGKKESDNIITTRTNFNLDSDVEGSSVWLDLTDDGKLIEMESETPKKGGLNTASCVCITTSVKPNSIKTSEFALAWDMPEIKFGLGKRVYSKWYTKFFDKSTLNGATLCLFTINNRIKWETAINEWQKPILDNSTLPDWYKSALFNESYFIADGGSIWLDVSDDTTLPEHIRNWGRFGYLESHEYRIINSYDVHFYASFALIQLWPNLELSIQYDYARVIENEKLESGTSRLKTFGSVPHDLGDPDEEPWLLVNAYATHNSAESKYILEIYRDFIYTKDREFLNHVWPTMQRIMTHLRKQDTDGDGLIDNAEFTDYTYDTTWEVVGASAYYGGLQVAALRACVELARILNDTNLMNEYEQWLELTKKSYSEKLWNGQYYNYDSSLSAHHESILSDQLAGFWYLRLSGHKYEDFEKDRVDNILQTIFKTNVMGLADGKLGAINRITKTGMLETVRLQPEEIWIGVTYALSSTMIMENLIREAFLTSEGIYNTCYNTVGLAFQIPEALTSNYRFRSCGFMRSLSIWAIQKALELSEMETKSNINSL